MAKTTTPTLATIRDRIKELVSDRQTLVDAPRARSESRSDIDAQCLEWAAIGEKRVAHPVGMVAFGSKINDLFLIRPQSGVVDLGPVLSLVVGPERLAAVLAVYLESRPDGITATERAAQIAEIEAQLLELERAEEALIEASEAAGLPIARRGDADPRAVLGV